MNNFPVRDEYTSSGFLVLRTPLLPIEEFLELSLATGAPRVPADSRGDRVSMRAQLRQWIQRPEVKEALWIASPAFVQSFPAWWEDPESAKGRKLEQALYRYLARMTARATPFGAFAGCSIGHIGNSTHLELSARSQYRRCTRLDMEYLCNLADAVCADPVLRRNLCFRPNTSLHLAAGKYHHLRSDWPEDAGLYQLVATDPTRALDATLLRAASGATAGALASALVESDPEIAQEDAEAFVGQLIGSQLLVADLKPPVTGAEPIRYMIEQLEQAKVFGAAGELRAVAEELSELDRGGLGADSRAYDGIVSAASRLGAAFNPGRLVQLDVIKPAAMASMDRALINDILDAVQALHFICGDVDQSALLQFKQEFRDRYQEQEVPLLEALDGEAGVGFEKEDNPMAEPLIAGIDFIAAEEASAISKNKKVQPLVARRLEELRAKEETVLALDSELLEALRVVNQLPLPGTFCVMGTLFRGAEGQPGFCLQSVLGPSGVNLFARFCHGDMRLAECVQAHVNAEEALHTSDAVFAEIAHLPEGRVGNVVCRPVLRQYEIPFLATPGVPVDRQITLSDLTVSLRNDRIVLRSRRLGAEVLPRLTSAHNFASPRSLKLYKFLCLLQHQGVCADWGWEWGAVGKASFLPRVTLGNIVVSLARWTINQETAPELAQGQTAVDQWRQTNQVPRFAFITEFDNQLLIDFENPLAVETFLEHIRKEPETLMVEMFPAPGALPVRGPEGSFVHEIILPFVRKQPGDAARVEASPPARALPATSALPGFKLDPGSKWLFAKLYCSPSHADRLLLEFVQPLVAEIKSAGTASRWFFVRYGDPRWHLRLRFQGDPAALSDHVLPALRRRAEPFQRQGTLWRLQFDPYEPEVERYGGPGGMAIAEQLFEFDSELCLDLLPLIQGDDGAQLRWQLAFSGADRILDGLGLSTKDRKTLAEHMRSSREQAWAVDETYKRQLAHKFRSGQMRQTLTAILNHFDDDAGSDEGVLPAEALSAFRRFSDGLQVIRAQWKDLHQAGQLTSTITELAENVVHMHLNRMLRSCHHEQEAILYDFLVRTYATKLARQHSTSLSPDATAP